MRSRSKYGARKTTIGGITYDSKREARRGEELRLLEAAGEIHDLRRQVRYQLLPSQRGDDDKVLYRPVYYVADFVYCKDGQTVVEDAKGVRTDVYQIKKKLMKYVHGITIKEV